MDDFDDAPHPTIEELYRIGGGYLSRSVIAKCHAVIRKGGTEGPGASAENVRIVRGWIIKWQKEATKDIDERIERMFWSRVLGWIENKQQ